MCCKNLLKKFYTYISDFTPSANREGTGCSSAFISLNYMSKRYQEYLRSEHWQDFRKQILSERKKCQNCCRKENLQLHHRHYKTLGHESWGDVIVLCGDCHTMFHKKKKRIKDYKKWKNLNFTYSKKIWDCIYTKGEIQRKCNRCWGEHPLFYTLFRTWQKALSIACPYSKPRIEFLKYEEMDLPTVDSLRKQRGNSTV